MLTFQSCKNQSAQLHMKYLQSTLAESVLRAWLTSAHSLAPERKRN
jgi:hypothetical protein